MIFIMTHALRNICKHHTPQKQRINQTKQLQNTKQKHRHHVDIL